MRRGKPRIRLGGVELQLPDVGTVLVPWREIGPRPHYGTSKLARELFPGVPQSIALSGLPRVRRVVRELQVRAAIRELDNPKFSRFQTCVFRSASTMPLIGAAYFLMHGAIVPSLIWDMRGELDGLVRHSTVALVCVAAIGAISLALLGGAVALAVVAVRAMRRFPTTLAVRITGEGVVAIHGDASERFIPWRELLALIPNRENLFAPSIYGAPGLACGSILLEAARKREQRRVSGTHASVRLRHEKPAIGRGLIASCISLVCLFGIAFGFANYQMTGSIELALRTGLGLPMVTCLVFAIVILMDRFERGSKLRTRRRQKAGLGRQRHRRFDEHPPRISH